METNKSHRTIPITDLPKNALCYDFSSVQIGDSVVIKLKDFFSFTVTEQIQEIERRAKELGAEFYIAEQFRNDDKNDFLDLLMITLKEKKNKNNGKSKNK
jgi:hypothetical protein